MTCANWWFLLGVLVSGVILFGLLWLAWRLISYWGGEKVKRRMRLEDKIKATIVALGLPALVVWLWIKIAGYVQSNF